MTENDQKRYPNVRARLRRTRQAPGIPALEVSMVIWLSGARFRVRDDNGRGYADIVDDVAVPRGFGALPRTIEGFMDAQDAARRPARGPTEFYGDAGTGEAIVHPAGRDPWTADIRALAPVAEQLLTGGREAMLRPVGEATQLGRRCREYRFSIEDDEAGIAYRSEVRWLAAAPFLLLREVWDAQHTGLYARIEVVELAEGVVTEAELRP